MFRREYAPCRNPARSRCPAGTRLPRTIRSGHAASDSPPSPRERARLRGWGDRSYRSAWCRADSIASCRRTTRDISAPLRARSGARPFARTEPQRGERRVIGDDRRGAPREHPRTVVLRELRVLRDLWNGLGVHPPLASHLRRREPRSSRGPRRRPSHEQRASRRARAGGKRTARRRDCLDLGEQLVGGLEALRRIFLEALQHHARKRAAEYPPRHRAAALGDVRAEHGLRRADERRMAGEHLVREHAKGVDVRAMVECPVAGRLLGRHVGRRAERGARLRERPRASPRSWTRGYARRLDRLRDAEVRDHGRAARRAARCPA